ncbi:MAG: hypothetical protein HFI61_14050 [Lachnospiraceae bacterium]|jgi:hypothetical protein|nr:hypothetical protein [Lachnospiraceae bacterium]
MRKTKRLVMFALTLLCLSGVVSTPVNAQVISDVHVHVTYEDPSGAEFTGDPFYNPIEGIQTRGIFDSYKVEADKEATQFKCTCEMINGFDFVCKGWVNITDKKSGAELKHSTTAGLSKPSDSGMVKGLVKETGVGKVWATSEFVHGYSDPRIFWDWVD